MSVELDEVRRIAALARVGVPEDRLSVLAQELSGILEHMAVLQRVDIRAAEDSASRVQTPLRADHGPPVQLLRPLDSLAPQMRDGFFIVPRLATHGGRSVGEDAPSAGEL